MSSPSSTDEDLRDVFKLLYAEDDWSFPPESEDENEDGEGEDQHPPLDSLIPDIELEIVDSQTLTQSIPPSSDVEIENEGLQSTAKYSRKRFFDALDSLLSSSPSISPSKKARIYIPTSTQLNSSSSIILSTQPIPSVPSPNTYAPYSPLALLARLRTFQSYSYPLDSVHLSPIKAALHGWVNAARHTLRCGSCKSILSLKGLDDIPSEVVREEVSKRLSRGFESSHKVNCPWRIRKSPDELYDQLRNSLHPLISSNILPLSTALRQSIPSLSSSIHLISPLTPTQELALLQRTSAQAEQSRESTLLAFFGWYPYHPNSPSTSDHVVSPNSSDNNIKKGKTDIIHCRICSRRIGLWTYTPTEKTNDSDTTAGEKGLDLVKEHSTWCPLHHRHGQGQGYWESSYLLKEKSSSGIETSVATSFRDWVKVSDKLEKKPWRRYPL
ncbi:uncharacterized protein I303_104816 [Kwoniella dejecticola CBS 10117]|uniref:C3HC-type domain-containing protein n=1 Tax=Kwoniella dejecticola CBS 10117 TaxID=1296121 RepID=A0A1A6A498_9TREE|nr:uncharacterized protein I303_04203 [Kwoniella dejecticola CBS 10117]OBR84881.1 hypothetical protein I303_04203 [Kwoniella dejecticola CBS 10117]